MKKKIMVLYIGFLLLLCACAGKNTVKSEQEIREEGAFRFKAADDTASTLKDVDLSVITADPDNEIIAITAGSNYTIGLKVDGTLVATGDNKYGQCDVQNWNLIE